MVQDGRDTWLPHLSLAYYNAVHDNRLLVEAIAPLRDAVVAEVPVSEIHLMSTPRVLSGGDRWTWPVHGVLKLKGKR